MGTLTSAVSSKRSVVSGQIGEPSSVTGRTGGGQGSSTNVNLLSSDRRPLNVLN